MVSGRGSRSASLVGLACVVRWRARTSGTARPPVCRWLGRCGEALDLEGSDLEMKTALRDRWRARSDRVTVDRAEVFEPSSVDHEVFDPPPYRLGATARRLALVWREQRRL